MAYVGTPIDTRNQFQSLQGKRFSGDGSTTDFTLDVAPGSTLDIEVFVGNVRQDPNSAYTLSGTTLSFTGAPPSGTNNIYVVHQAKSVGTIGIPDDTISARTLVTADSSADHVIIEDATDGELKKALYPSGFSVSSITGATALDAVPADTDEFVLSDAGTLKRTDFKNLIQNGPFFSARQTSNQNIANTTLTKVEFSTEIADPSGTYDNSTNYRFTPGVVGKYLIGANVTVKDVGDGKKVQVAIYENGSNMNGSQAAFMNTNGVNENLTVGGTWLLDVDSTSDYYEIYVYQNKGSTQELRGDFFNNFYGFRVG
jgi:hypothetical protein